MKETWKQIKEHPNYMASNLGGIKNVKTGKLIKGYVKGGYRSIDIKGKHFRVHRLVAGAFLENPLCLPFVNHIDGDKLNNQVENLEWITHRDNCKHAKEHGLYASGERQGKAKLKTKQVREIRSKYIPWKVSSYQLAKEYGVSQSAIRDVLSGKRWQALST